MQPNLFSLEGKVALVTGASRGLGQAMAVGLAAAGADVAGLDRSESTQTRELIAATGRRYHDLSADLLQTSPADLSRTVDDIVHALGGLDILVNNAGIIRDRKSVV